MTQTNTTQKLSSNKCKRTTSFSSNPSSQQFDHKRSILTNRKNQKKSPANLKKQDPDSNSNQARKLPTQFSQPKRELTQNENDQLELQTPTNIQNKQNRQLPRTLRAHKSNSKHNTTNNDSRERFKKKKTATSNKREQQLNKNAA